MIKVKVPNSCYVYMYILLVFYCVKKTSKETSSENFSMGPYPKNFNAMNNGRGNLPSTIGRLYLLKFVGMQIAT